MPKKKKKLWFPTLLQSSFSKYIPSNYWHDTYLIDSGLNQAKLKHRDIKTSYVATRKYLVYPTKEQHQKLQKWFKAVIDRKSVV